MRFLISLGFALCLIVPFIGTWGWMHMEKGRIRSEVKRNILRGLDKNELVSLRFSLKETQTILDWHHSEEFEFNGQMYDVVESQSIGDSIVYLCWADHKETALNKQMDELIRQKTDHKNKQEESQRQLAQFAKLLYHKQPDQYCTLSTYHSKAPMYNPGALTLPEVGPPPSPPPEVG